MRGQYHQNSWIGVRLLKAVWALKLDWRRILDMQNLTYLVGGLCGTTSRGDSIKLSPSILRGRTKFFHFFIISAKGSSLYFSMKQVYKNMKRTLYLYDATVKENRYLMGRKLSSDLKIRYFTNCKMAKFQFHLS